MLKKVLKALGVLLLSAGALVFAFAAYVAADGIPKYPHASPVRHVESSPERVARGRKFATLLCAGCHMDPRTRRLTGKRMDDAPSLFGPLFSRNITGSTSHGIGAWTDGELAYLLRTGVRPDGQYIPPYMVKLPHLSDDDLDSIIAFLRSGDPLVAPEDVDPPGRSEPSFVTKLLSHVAFKPLPYPTERIVAPPATDRVGYGRYLVFGLDCYTCHSADITKGNTAEPEKTPGYMGGGAELLDVSGKTVPSANLTPDEETGIGKWSEADFVRALRFGIRPNGKAVHYPMMPMPELDADEAGAIYAYLRTVPKIRHAVARVVDESTDADPGTKAYVRYGCASCHGEKGVGIADLTRAKDDFPTDDALLAWILDAPKIRPGTKMPAWRGIIAESDYGPLVAHVRKLGEKRAQATAAR
jgi:mono/diheme cytochrome c family protein